MQKILLLGSYGRRNVGDDIYLMILLQKLSYTTIYFNCYKIENLPPEIKLTHTTIPIPSKSYGGITLLRLLWQSSCVVYGGGELWMKLDGVAQSGASLYKMLIINILARLLGKKIYYISVGAEPLKGWHRFVARLSAKLATTVYLRDPESAPVLGLKKGRYKMVPDMAYLLPVYEHVIPGNVHRAPKNITISVSGYITSTSKNAKNHLNILADFINTQFSGAHITIVAAMADPLAPEHDQKTVALLSKKIKLPTSSYAYKSLDDFKDILLQSDLVVSYRLHVNILCHILGVPIIGIAYRPKVAKYFETYGDRGALCSVENLSIDLSQAVAHKSQSYTLQKALTKKTIAQATAEYGKLFIEMRKSN